MSTLPLYGSRNDFFVDARTAGLFNMPRGAVGSLAAANIGQDSVKTLINTNPQAKQVSRIEVDASPTSSYEYIVKVAGKNVSFTSDASATRNEVGEGLRDALNNDPIAGGAAVWTWSSPYIYGTGTVAGVAFTVSLVASDGKLTLTTPTSAAVADPVPFGRAIVKLPDTYTGAGSECCALASTAVLTAQVDTLTVAYSAGKAYQVNITVDEVTYPSYVVAATDLATLTTAIATAINGAMPANTVDADGSTAGTVILTAEVAGKPFVVSIGAQTTPGNLTVAHTEAGLDTNFYNVWAGVSLIADNVEGVYTTDSDAGAQAYKPNAGVRACSRAAGGVYVANAQTPTDSSRVYVELAPGDDAGKFYTDASATRILMPRHVARWQGNPLMAGDELGILCVAPY